MRGTGRRRREESQGLNGGFTDQCLGEIVVTVSTDFMGKRRKRRN